MLLLLLQLLRLYWFLACCYSAEPHIFIQAIWTEFIFIYFSSSCILSLVRSFVLSVFSHQQHVLGDGDERKQFKCTKNSVIPSELFAMFWPNENSVCGSLNTEYTRLSNVKDVKTYASIHFSFLFRFCVVLTTRTAATHHNCLNRSSSPSSLHYYVCSTKLECYSLNLLFVQHQCG